MSDAGRSVMIFAAGFGTRMGAMTRQIPKPMLPLAGRPMIDHSVEIAREAHASPILVNTHYLHEKIAPYLEKLGVSIQFETPDILDTGGGLKLARGRLTDPTYTLNPDVVFVGPNPLSVLAGTWKDEMEALLLVSPTSGWADFSLADEKLIRGGSWLYTGAQLIRTGGLDGVDGAVFSLNVFWDAIADRGGLFGVEYPGLILDAGTPEGLAAASRKLGADNV